MNQSKTTLLTPIYIKPRPDTSWPEDSVFYMLTASGLFLCRNHPFYQSAVPAPRCPVELAKQESFLAVRYPKISCRLMEYIVGYFDCVADTHGTEAAVLLAFNKTTGRVQIVVPDQVATVTRNGWGDVFPIGVEYEVPTNLSPELVLIGDVHSHVDSAAYASYVDKHDETYRPGLHIVVGRLNREPPEFHFEAVTDGTRFTVARDLVLDGYRQRRTDIPDEWMDKITVKSWGKKYRYDDDKDGKDRYDEKHRYDDDKDRRHDDKDGGDAHGNGEAGRREPVYETGFDPGDDDIQQEILENLEKAEAEVDREPLETADGTGPGAETDAPPKWELKKDEVPMLPYEKPAASGPANRKKSKDAAKPRTAPASGFTVRRHQAP